jgi:hypothetical protein
MSLEAHERIAVVVPPKIERVEPPIEVKTAPELLPSRTPEELRAMEAVFAQQQQESDKVAGLLTMWTGVAVLRDVFVDTFTEPAGEVEVEPKKKKGRE